MPAKIPSSPNFSLRAAYSLTEWRTMVLPMAEAIVHREINAGRLKSFKIGWRRYIPASEREDYPRRLAAESGHDEAA